MTSCGARRSSCSRRSRSGSTTRRPDVRRCCMISSRQRAIRPSAESDRPPSLKDVPICGFLGRKAEEARTRAHLPVSEPRFKAETIRFYGTERRPLDGDAGMELNREIQKIGVDQALDREKLLFRRKEA